jgi:hypothetical protein
MSKLAKVIIGFLALLIIVWLAPVIPIRQNKSIAPNGLPCGIKNDPNWNYIPCPDKSELFETVFKSGKEIYQEKLIKG